MNVKSKIMKNAKVKGKEGKSHKKLRVAKFNFCTLGMPLPFHSNLSMYDYRPPINNSIVSMGKNPKNDFSVCSYNDSGKILQSPASPLQSSPISVCLVPQLSHRLSVFSPMQYFDSRSLKDNNSEREMNPIIRRQLSMNQDNFFSNVSNKESENYHTDESNLSSNGVENQNFISKSSIQNENFNSSNFKDDEYSPNINSLLSNFSEPSSFHDIIPSSFDIVKRGPLPSIMLRTDGKIEFSDF